MEIGKIINLIFCLISLYWIIKFRQVGRDAMSQQKKINKMLGTREPQKNFEGMSVSITQGVVLIAGVLVFIANLANLLR